MKPARNRDSDRNNAHQAPSRRTYRGRLKLIVWGLVVAGFAAAGHAVWTRVREHVATRDDYRLTPKDISITRVPPWIRTDVKAEVIRDTLSGEPLSILDDRLVERIYQAFSLHPWVAKVERVSKSHPAHVEVEIAYRRPVAMVEVPGGLYPVDVDGVLLPSEDFSPLEARAYARISGIESTPLGMMGTKWGDPVVAGGARIAGELQTIWGDLGLRSIRWAKPTADSDPSAPALFELITAAGSVMPWGAPPGGESAGEPTAQEKILRIKAYIAQHGSLDEPTGGPKDLDLRRPDPAPRTAARPN
jgi:hypothetical protein